MLLVVKQGYEKNHGCYAKKLWPEFIARKQCQRPVQENIARNNYQRIIRIEGSNPRYFAQDN